MYIYIDIYIYIYTYIYTYIAPPPAHRPSPPSLGRKKNSNSRVFDVAHASRVCVHTHACACTHMRARSMHMRARCTPLVSSVVDVDSDNVISTMVSRLLSRNSRSDNSGVLRATLTSGVLVCSVHASAHH